MSNWRDATLGEEISLAYGKSLPANARLPGPIGVFGSNGLVGTHTEACVDGPGIVVGRKGSVGEVVYSSDAFWPIDTTYYVVNKGAHNWRFLFHLLRHVDLTGLNSHSAVPGLNREDAYSIVVRWPSRSEQDDIARVLDCLEDGIQLEVDALAHAQKLNQAAMRELFTRGLRGEPQKETEIGAVPESWRVTTFSEVREWLQYGTSIHCTLEPRRFPVLRIPNIEPGRVNASDLKYCDLTDEDANKYLLENGDLLFIRTNGVLERLGSCAVYEGVPQKSLFASYLIRARLKPGIDPRYAAYFYASQRGTSLVAGRATPAADGKYNLNTGTIDSLPLPLPPTLEEQRDIVAVLDALDRKIDLHQRKRTVLEDLFKALREKLMTGEIAVDELELSAMNSPVVTAEEATV